MKRIIPILTCSLVAVLISGCDKKNESVIVQSAEPGAIMLAGDIAESFLPEIRYKRITDSAGASRQGGGDFPNAILKLDAARYKPLASQWAGIKSLDPIPGKGENLFFRYVVTAELYPDVDAAKRRNDEFDSSYNGHAERERSSLTKQFIPVFHFSHDRIFYLFTTDMAASMDSVETGKLRFAVLKHLSE